MLLVSGKTVIFQETVGGGKTVDHAGRGLVSAVAARKLSALEHSKVLIIAIVIVHRYEVFDQHSLE